MKELILGIIQGATEFLPISSSGHLAIISHILDIDTNVAMFAVLHLATFFAVLVFVWQELVEIIKGIFSFNRKVYSLIMKLVISTLPAAVFGVLAESKVNEAFSMTKIIAIFFFMTSAALYISDKLGKNKDFYSLTFFDALIIGLFQAFAIFPGISRSGFTLFGALLIGMGREKALKYSFLMSLPIIFGAGMLEMKKVTVSTQILWAGVAAFLVGLLGLYLLKKFTLNKKLKYFAYYCFVIGIVTLVI
ncbi:undecaprenyl-diphosphate phosphatase [Thermosipho ferrireducens]|uniref:Undecaprenyl-diphosphatase n=1 Tax=Thermosipho ferrireducens TaxID=2571116 RepID=A0ABX7SBD8_9BACT|nr:undecaprenyl-diphosphate phosphatase [Thermosipho ferrireducens]QTA38836.1 undecaprenyl-diphosphate phosphatase [Thermosipho ferrireducens]